MPAAVSLTLTRDAIFYIKNFLTSNITDPVTRPANQAFLLSEFPKRPVDYPVIIVRDVNREDATQLGFQSQAMKHYITMEVQIWARNVRERDQLADQIYDNLRTNQIGATGTSQAADLHDFRLLSSVNLSDPNGPKRKIQTYRFLFIAA